MLNKAINTSTLKSIELENKPEVNLMIQLILIHPIYPLPLKD